MSLADTSTFTRRLDDLGVAVSAGPPAECAAMVEAAAGDPAVGVSLGRSGPDALADSPATLPDRIETDPTTADLRRAHTGVTAASLGVAAYGSVALEADAAGTEPVSLFVDRHVVVLREADLVPDMPDAFDWLGPRARDESVDVVFATGPSATADMGGLVHGAHGPKEVHVVLLRDGGAGEDGADDVDADEAGPEDADAEAGR
ncbi:L-lactate dehydrogenase complex protein LldG [Halorubrum xinjiangense]|uniref:L-lactate dehydrogenase complex protein LldG n=1 Tax=Halorubrum xinjiangense TaxID=261291 RepID=A0A1G7SJQ3_9EURY|nr:LUD domain-containing protein [Halorubrum xinjiangense]SDG22480.1 L-lactate dehydrogenase complex protein LldG [Halorubrum xinjiangense]